MLSIVGDAGIGKTTLLEAARRQAKDMGLQLGSGHGDPAETALPFGVMHQALTAVRGDSPLATLADTSPANAGVTDARAALFYAVIRWLESVAQAPILLAVDDLHWADADSLALLGVVARRLERLPIGIIVTMRPWPPAALDAMQSMRADGHVSEERLHALSYEAAGELLDRRARREVDSEMHARAWQLTAGNPLLLEQAALLVEREGKLPQPGQGEYELLTPRFAGLSEQGRRFAQAAAVFGLRFRGGIAGRLAGVDDSDIDEAVAALATNGLIRAESEDHLEFVHPLFQQALYDSIPMASRQRMHARAFGILEELGARAEAAEQAVLGDLFGNAAAIGTLEGAGTDALRSGAVWLKQSRRYADPETYLIPKARWPELRPEVCKLTGSPIDGVARLADRRRELEELLERFDKRMATAGDDGVRIADGRLIVPRLPAEDAPPGVARLEQLVSERLPLIELPDLMLEVDGWTRFSGALEHAGKSEPRSKNTLVNCHASILAHACNFGLTRMARIADLSYSSLAWHSTWYLREETLSAANTKIVNVHFRHPLTRLWGGGTMSSSDGQRFPVPVQARNATAIPRYFGFGRGLTFYSWTSDQFSQYGCKPVPSTMRDARFVLDGILGNETELPIDEHTTDHAGYSDLLFGVGDLLGLQLCPRIADLGDKSLYRFDKSIRYSTVGALLRKTIRRDRILSQWDDLLRVVGSLKLGWVTASLFIGKLQSYRQQNALARGFQEYGRVVKTIFILRYLEDEAFRRRIGAQLNKGESLHALRNFLFLANLGQIRRRALEDQANQALCLTVVTNAVILWNTVYMARVLEQLRAEGHEFSDDDVAHLSPARFEHINPFGRYHFDVALARSRAPARPLRKP